MTLGHVFILFAILLTTAAFLGWIVDLITTRHNRRKVDEFIRRQKER